MNVGGQDCGGRGGTPLAGQPGENALPGIGPWVHVCGGQCGICGASCVLQRAGHLNHLCAIHKIPYEVAEHWGSPGFLRFDGTCLLHRVISLLGSPLERGCMGFD